MSREMLINAIDAEECRIAVVEGGELQELYVERASSERHVGNIYKGRVTNVEPGIQAAFIDYGQPKNGFLHVSDVVRSYVPDGLKKRGAQRPSIQDVFKRGQEVIVQVTKEGIGTKGPSLTTYLSIAGRYLVLMPGMNRIGVSRKIEDEKERRKLRDQLEGLDRPKNMGVIVRTAGTNQSKTELQRDLRYLKRVWEMVSERIKTAAPPAEIYRESDLVVRTIRDIYSSDIQTIHVDDPDVAKRVRDFLRVAMPRYVKRVQTYEDKVPLFHLYGLEAEIEKIYARNVPLPCGGYLVIDQTEALVAVDVNSGKYRSERNPEEAAYKLNVESAREIVRQLRLRDLGGVIVMDFVDMRSDKHRRSVEDVLRQELKRDRARSKFLRTSRFGLIEMTRQRMRPSIKRSTFMDCPHCKGSGLIKTPESMSLDVMRQITLAVGQENIRKVEITVNPTVGHYLHNRKRHAIARLEQRTGKQIMVISDPNVGQEAVNFHCQDNRGIPIAFDPHEVSKRRKQELLQKQRADENKKDEAGDRSGGKKKRSGRGRRRSKSKQKAEDKKDKATGEEKSPDKKAEKETSEEKETEHKKKKKPRSRRRRRRKKPGKTSDGNSAEGESSGESQGGETEGSGSRGESGDT